MYICLKKIKYFKINFCLKLFTKSKNLNDKDYFFFMIITYL